MAYTRKVKSSLISSIGQKVRHGVELLGTMKGIYDTGKTIYSGIQAAAPLIAGLL